MRDSRNYFARIRTLMANERTLMSYYRAAMALLGISAFLYKFFSSKIFTILSIVFLVISTFTAVYGYTRYRFFKKKILKK